MELYKVKCSLFGKETVYSAEILNTVDLSHQFINFLGELAVELVFWEMKDNNWVRITRKEFGKRFHIYVEVDRHVGDIILKGQEWHPVKEDDIVRLMYKTGTRDVHELALQEYRANQPKVRPYHPDDAEVVDVLLKNAGFQLTHDYVDIKLLLPNYHAIVVERKSVVEAFTLFGVLESKTVGKQDILIEITAVDKDNFKSSYRSLLHYILHFSRKLELGEIKAKQVNSFVRPELNLKEFTYTRDAFSNIISNLKG
jgi:aspartate 1-decarboxylase